MPQDNFKPPMAAEQLRQIGLRRDAADVIPLLWEIKRLRALVLRADQVVQGIRNGDYIVEIFRKELAGEPVLEEQAQRRAMADVSAKPEGDRNGRAER